MIDEVLAALPQDENRLYGLTGASKAAVIAALYQTRQKIFVITHSTKEAQNIRQEIYNLDKNLNALMFPAPDYLPGENKNSPEASGQRLSVLNNISASENFLAIAPIRAVLYKTSSGFKEQICLSKGKDADLQALADKLLKLGYKRYPIVGEIGEFSVRGGIVDIYPSNAASPIRAEFAFDRIESIRQFNPATQRSNIPINEAQILSNIELKDVCVIDVLPKGTLIIIDEEEMAQLHAEQFFKDALIIDKEQTEIIGYSKLKQIADKRSSVYLFSWLAPGANPALPRDLMDKIGGTKSLPIKEKAIKDEGVGEDIRADFSINDYVVHEDYGIGIYRGLRKIEEGEYVLIEFANEDKLYVPASLMGKLEKYVSEENYRPRLSNMGGTAWQALKARVKKSVKDLTEELLLLYAERQKARKIPYGKDDAWQKQLEETFPYEETPDQLKAIADIKKDLESQKPMDRLVCGDVGYGKTEVALRAIVKVASAGRQVSVLVPTTILAEQHYHFFKDRLEQFPFKVAALSRFRSLGEQKEIAGKLQLGKIDIVVGTHRLLQKDVQFKDLGLLVIDEEHRFGVSHKEKIKKMKKNIDVLNMTATPIPRTLYMSMSGARDLSLIQTPPKDRSPVRTYVAKFNEVLVREAILREIDRGGQIFFVHNRIESIDTVSSRLKKIIPGLKIAVAHGRMNGSALEKIMGEFLDKKYDVLLCTAIIESGLDMPNVNTILIDKADKLGLAELYQLRGRVGRSSVRAYAYLLYHPEEILTETALSRLQAIQEFTMLGSGYKLALRDLEIRGAGNLLGAQQHGHMLSIGFDLYRELLEEAVNEIKGIKEPTIRQITIDLPYDAHIPEDYVEDEQQRIALYRRLNLLGTNDEIKDFKEELRDRFGKVPPQTLRLFEVVALKARAQKAGIKSIRGDSKVLVQYQSGKTVKLILKTNDRIKEIINRLSL